MIDVYSMLFVVWNDIGKMSHKGRVQTAPSCHTCDGDLHSSNCFFWKGLPNLVCVLVKNNSSCVSITPTIAPTLNIAIKRILMETLKL